MRAIASTAADLVDLVAEATTAVGLTTVDWLAATLDVTETPRGEAALRSVHDSDGSAVTTGGWAAIDAWPGTDDAGGYRAVAHRAHPVPPQRGRPRSPGGPSRSAAINPRLREETSP
jgi:hypothetical protein